MRKQGIINRKPRRIQQQSVACGAVRKTGICLRINALFVLLYSGPQAAAFSAAIFREKSFTGPFVHQV